MDEKAQRLTTTNKEPLSTIYDFRLSMNESSIWPRKSKKLDDHM